MRLELKLKKLRGIIKAMDSALVAFSGGADSTFLLSVAADTLKNKLLAVTGVSPSLTKSEKDQAVSLAKSLRIKHLLVADNPPKEFWENSPQRCYYCKKELFKKLKRLADKRKLQYVLDATNADDSGDYRPGARALKELGIRSPLKEADLTKLEIRQLSRKMGLKTWNKPAMACLASRVPYGERITGQKLSMVGKAEEFICSLGFDQVRVRLHEQLARIEVEPEKIVLAMKKRKVISAQLKSMGFTYVSIDLDGYRRGSLNEGLAWIKKR